MRWSLFAAMLAMSCVTMAGERGGAVEDPSLTLPISRVTLYAGGAAYVEHKGTLRGDATIELRVPADQLSSVLRSMLVQDDDGGKLAASVAPLDPTATRASAERKLNLNDNPTQADILDELRGVRVRITCGQETFGAAIVSVESRTAGSATADKGDGTDSKSTKASDARVPLASELRLNVLGEGGLRSIPLDKISRIDIEDPAAQRQLNRALRDLWQANKRERQTIVVRVGESGSGERTVRLGYALETQPWTMSYRLLLGDKPSVQAWATVTNDTEQPWNQVKLNLMSGLPVMLAGDASGDANSISKAAKAAGVPAGQSLRRPMPLASRDALDGFDDSGKPHPRGGMIPDAPLANPREAFRFVTDRVTVPPQASTAVAVLNEPLAVERVSVYNDAFVRRNPLQGALVKNSLKQYLLQGAVTVIDDGVFAGEGRLENLAPARSGLVTWGVDLPVLVDASDNTYAAAVKDAHIAKGVLQIDEDHRYVRRYVVENEDRKDRILIIEHPIRRGWKLVETVEPFDVTETHYRFRLTVPSGKKVTFTVTEQTGESQPIELSTAEVQTLRPYLEDAKLGKEVREAIGKVIQLKERVAEAQQRLEQGRAEAKQIAQEQARIRANIRAAGASGPLRESLREKLAESEKSLERLQDQLEKARQTIDDARRDLDKSVETAQAAG